MINCVCSTTVDGVVVRSVLTAVSEVDLCHDSATSLKSVCVTLVMLMSLLLMMSMYFINNSSQKKSCLILPSHKFSWQYISVANTYILPRYYDFCRAMLCTRTAIAVAWCLSVRLSRSWIMSKRINIYSKFFHHWVATPF